MPASSRIARLAIVASGDCNLACSYCRLRRSAGSPPWASVQPALDALLASRDPTVSIAFTGGEPLLAFPLVRRVVSYVSRTNRVRPVVRYRLSTNGLLLTDAAAGFLARHRFDVQVSLDGGPDTQADRGGRALEGARAALARLRRGRGRFFRDHVAVAATITPARVGALARSVRFLVDEGVATIRLGPAMGLGPARDCSRVLDREFRLIFELMRDHLARTGRVPLEAFRKDLPLEAHQRHAGWFCAAPTGRVRVIDADGTQAPCVMATTTYAPTPPAALRPFVDALRRSCREGSRARVDPSTPALRLFAGDGGRYSSFSRCAECRWGAACTVCPLAAVQEDEWQDALRVPDFACVFTRTLLRYSELFPAQ